MDGKEIRSYSKEEYWKILGVVFQDFALIGLPLAENIAASAQYDEKKVRRCLKDIGLEEWADQLKNGLNEWMSAMEGTAPSGGERQRLALARAQYRDPSLMLLDEPTAALDPVAESEIFKKCREITGSTSAVYISHRLSACRFSDRILVFDDGHIIQEGHHEVGTAKRYGVQSALAGTGAVLYIINKRSALKKMFVKQLVSYIYQTWYKTASRRLPSMQTGIAQYFFYRF